MKNAILLVIGLVLGFSLTALTQESQRTVIMSNSSDSAMFDAATGPQSITFYEPPDGVVFTMKPDGGVEFGPGFKTKQKAARDFWAYLASQFPKMVPSTGPPAPFLTRYGWDCPDPWVDWNPTREIGMCVTSDQWSALYTKFTELGLTYK